MKKLKINNEDFVCFLNACKDYKLERIDLDWDGYGGLEIDYFPKLKNKEVDEKLTDLFYYLVKELELYWGLILSINDYTENNIYLNIQVFRNISYVEGVNIEVGDIINDKLIIYLNEKYNDAIILENVYLTINQSGDFEGNFDCNYELKLMDSETEINDSEDEFCKQVIGENIYKYIIENHKIIGDDPGKYEFEFEHYRCDGLTIIPDDFELVLIKDF